MNNLTSISDDELKDKIRNVLRRNYPCSIRELCELLEVKRISNHSIHRIRTLIPRLEGLLEGNVVIRELSMHISTSPRKVAKKRAPTKDDVPEVYRRGSNYQAVFSFLYKSRDRGITREKLLKEVMALTGRSEKLCHYDINIVSSPESCENGGGGHKSSRADVYWIEKGCGGFLRLHMR